MKNINWLLGVMLMITFFVTPVLYSHWQKEKEIANIYQKAFFDMQKIAEECSYKEILVYIKEKEKHEKIMNHLAGELSKIYKTC